MDGRGREVGRGGCEEKGISYNGVYVKFEENLIDVIETIQMIAINKYRILINVRVRTYARIHVFIYLSMYVCIIQ